MEHVGEWIEEGMFGTPCVEWRRTFDSGDRQFGQIIAIEMETFYHELPKTELMLALERAQNQLGLNPMNRLLPIGQIIHGSDIRCGCSSGG